MSSRAWMPLYVGDYLADTSHLSAEAHGVYLLLLMRCWAKGSIPADRMQCMSIAHAMHEQSRSIVDAIIDEFFVLQDDGYHNKRIDIEREKACQSYERRAGAALTRWSKKSDGCNADAMQMQPQPQPQPQPHSKPKPEPKKSLLVEAEAIYAAYPRKQGRGKALKAIDNALRTKPFPELLEAVQAYAGAVSRWTDAELAFVPHPATWFNAERWSDDRATWERKNGKAQNNLTRSFDPTYYEEK